MGKGRGSKGPRREGEGKGKGRGGERKRMKGKGMKGKGMKGKGMAGKGEGEKYFKRNSLRMYFSNLAIKTVFSRKIRAVKLPRSNINNKKS